MDLPIGSFLDRLQGFFSKSFILSGFLPLAAVLILNGLLLQWVLPETRPILRELLLPASGSVLPNWVLLGVLTYVLGMVLASLNPGLRHLLEGRFLPAPIQDWKRRQFYAELQERQAERETLSTELFRLRKASQPDKGWVKALMEARLIGDKLPDDGEPLDSGLKQRYAQLKERQLGWQPVRLDELQSLFTPLKSELQSRPASKIPELDRMQVGFAELLEYACGKVEIEYSRVEVAIRLRYPRRVGGLQPTQLANLAEVHREYGLDRFGLDSDLFWLRLLKLARADKDFYPLLDDAKTQLDFAVAVTVLLGLTVLVWFPLSMLFAPTIWPYLLIAVIGLPAVVIFYRVVIQAYGTFAEVVRAALDLYRFDMLKALHLQLPEDLAEEKDTWQKLARLAAGAGVDLVYQHGEQKAAENAADKAKQNSTPVDDLWERLKTLLGLR